jgi:hypothetical protein
VIINASFDSSVSLAPSGFITAVNAVIQFFEDNFNDAITININVSYGEVGGQSLPPGAIGASITSIGSSTYSQIKTRLAADAKTADDSSSVASLPPTDPFGTTYSLPRAEAKALGVVTANSSSTDGSIGFSSSGVTFDYDRSNGISVGTYDFFGVVAHELTEVMGRTFGNGDGQPLDLFHYTSPGILTFSGTDVGYFSVDNGVTPLLNFNINTSGDFSDWANSAGADAFRAFAPGGTLLAISETDLRAMDVLGYDRTSGILPTPAVRNDFDGDGKADIVFQNTDGTPAVWLMNGATLVSAAGLFNSGPTWHIKGSGDFNGDGKADLLWQSDGGTPAIWLMNGTTLVSAAGLQHPGPGWQIKGAGDLDGDGKSDIVWQNTDGTPAVWLMNGTTLVSAAGLFNSGPTWQIKSTGDFDGDGKADILWQNDGGTPAIWLMNGTALVSAAGLLHPGPGWQIKAAGDLDGDGKSDIVWQNTNGTPAVWLMNGTTLTSATGYGNPGTSWHIKDTGDLNGDGKADIIWQNDNGMPAVWFMNGTTPLSTSALVNPGPSWHVIAGVGP